MLSSQIQAISDRSTLQYDMQVGDRYRPIYELKQGHRQHFNWFSDKYMANYSMWVKSICLSQLRREHVDFKDCKFPLVWGEVCISKKAAADDDAYHAKTSMIVPKRYGLGALLDKALGAGSTEHMPCNANAKHVFFRVQLYGCQTLIKSVLQDNCVVLDNEWYYCKLILKNILCTEMDLNELFSDELLKTQCLKLYDSVCDSMAYQRSVALATVQRNQIFVKYVHMGDFSRDNIWHVDAHAPLASPIVYDIPLGVAFVNSTTLFQDIQLFLNRKVISFESFTKVQQLITEVDTSLHYILGRYMQFQEVLGEQEWMQTTGSIKAHLNTPVECLGVYDKILRPNGILLFPTLHPDHLIRLVEWTEQYLPRLDPVSELFHCVSIDSEGDYFQIHCESGGCLIVHVGPGRIAMDECAELILDKYSCDVSLIAKNLTSSTKCILRQMYLSRDDIVYAGDSGGCPFGASWPGDNILSFLANKQQKGWQEKDIYIWYDFLEGLPDKDYIVIRLASRACYNDSKNKTGFKYIEECIPAVRLGKGNCICITMANHLQTSHPSMCKLIKGNHITWHKYPQGGASKHKNLECPLHWSILYYAIADLIQVRSITESTAGPAVKIKCTPSFKTSS